MKTALSTAFHLFDRNVLGRLPEPLRARAYLTGLRARSLIQRRPLPPGVDPYAYMRDLHTARTHGKSMPAWLAAEIGDLRRNVDAGLYAGGLPKAHPLHTHYPSFPVRDGRRFAEIMASVSSAPTHLIVLPWLRRGGADLVAIHFANAVAATPGQRPMVVLTEESTAEWRGRLASNVDFLDLHGATRDLRREGRLAILTRLILQMAPHAVHNINSGLCWAAYARHGKALSQGSRLFASLFADGPPGADGIPTGYAHECLTPSLPHLSGVLSDNASYLAKLRDRFGLPGSISHVVHVPTELGGAGPDPEPGTRRVLWAGRVEPDKGPETIPAIARLLPDVAFEVFGPTDRAGPLLQTLGALPNVRLRGAYDGFHSIPAEGFGAHLYTSGNGGIPNILVESGARGFPVVAPDVGGIHELVDGDTGWLVPPTSGPEGMAAALRACLGDAALAARRGAALAERVRSNHSHAAFAERVSRLDGYLAPAPGRVGAA